MASKQSRTKETSGLHRNTGSMPSNHTNGHRRDRGGRNFDGTRRPDVPHPSNPPPNYQYGRMNPPHGQDGGYAGYVPMGGAPGVYHSPYHMNQQPMGSPNMGYGNSNYQPYYPYPSAPVHPGQFRMQQPFPHQMGPSRAPLLDPVNYVPNREPYAIHDNMGHPNDRIDYSHMRGQSRGRNISNLYRGRSRGGNNLQRASSTASMESVGIDDNRRQHSVNRNDGHRVQGAPPRGQRRPLNDSSRKGNNCSNLQRSNSSNSVNSVDMEDNRSHRSNDRGRGHMGQRRANRGHFNRGRGGTSNSNLERANSSTSINDDGKEDKRSHFSNNRGREHRGRGGRNVEHQNRGRGGVSNTNVPGTNSFVSTSSVGKEDNRSRSSDYAGRGRGRGRFRPQNRRGRGRVCFGSRGERFRENENETVNAPPVSDQPFHDRGRGRQMRNMDRFRGRRGWAFLTARKNMTSCSSDLEDDESVISEVSTFDTISTTEKGSSEIPAINLNDIFSISLETLKNRIYRHRRRLSDMKKKKIDQNEIKQYENSLELEVKARDYRAGIESVDANSKAGQASAPAVSVVGKELIPGVSNPGEDKGKLSTSKKFGVSNKVKPNVSFRTNRERKFKPKARKVQRCTNVSGLEENSASDDEWEDEVDSQQLELGVKEPSDDSLYSAKGKKGEVDEIKIKSEKKRQRNRKKKQTTVYKSASVEDNGSNWGQNINHILNQLQDIIDNKQDSVGNEQCEKEKNAKGAIPKKKNKDKDIPKSQPQIRKTSNGQKEKMSGRDDEEILNSKSGILSPEIQNRQGRAGSESGAPSPDVNEVFKFMVKNLEGKGTVEEIVRESGLFPVPFDAMKWFRGFQKRRFNLMERKGDTELVLVWNRDVGYCLDYLMKACNNPECRRYHVCKDMLSGHCMYGEKCKKSHDFLDDWNMKISKQLGFSNVFNNEQICSILRVRYPHLCESWADTGKCGVSGCYDMHLCPRFIFGKCLEGDQCALGHDRLSEHNGPIVNNYNMGKWKDGLFRKMVYVVRKNVHKENLMGPAETAGVESVLGHQENQKERRRELKSISEDSEDADSTFLCISYLEGKRCARNCQFIHSDKKKPYIWQIKVSGQWVSIDESEDIEKSFCEKADHSSMVQMLHDGMEIGARIFFKPYIRGVARIGLPDTEQMSVDARRLSTISFAKSQTRDFVTQWRWSWKDNDGQWQLYEPDTMQHTLENKFLSSQMEYNYSRENYKFKYTISFSEMHQTNLEYGTVRKVVRRPLFMSNSDIENKSFPPSLSDAPVITVPLPQNWVPWDLVNPFELVKLAEHEKAYQLVREYFYKTLNPRQHMIADIFHVQNHKLWMLFKHQEECMQNNSQRVGNMGTVEKRYLFHGTTSLNAVRGICINNFDMRVSGTHGTMYGEGAYFARDAKYSHNYTTGPTRLMFLCSVLVGQFTKGEKSYRRPPDIPGSQHELYDSCVDNIEDPKIFVVFDKNQFYPDYLIQYEDLNDASIPVDDTYTHLKPASVSIMQTSSHVSARPTFFAPQPPSPPAQISSGTERRTRQSFSSSSASSQPLSKEKDACSVQ